VAAFGFQSKLRIARIRKANGQLERVVSAYIVDFFISGIYSSFPSKQADGFMKLSASQTVGFSGAQALSVLAVVRISLLTPVLLREAMG